MTIVMQGVLPETREAANEKGIRTYSETYWLTTNQKTDGTYEVGSHPDLPTVGSVHHTDTGAWCTAVKPKCVSGYVHFHVTCTFSSERELAEDPTDEPALTEWDGEQFQRPLVIDEDGNIVCNSAGDPFDPPEMIDDSRLISVTTKNLAAVPTWIINYSNAVNSDAFTLDGFSVGIGQAKMQTPKVSKPMSRNGTTYREVQFTIHYRKEGWLSDIIDAGFRERVPGSGSGSGSESGLRNIRNPDDNELPAAPVPLDGNGSALDNPGPLNNVKRTFRGYRRLPFASLPLT
jgi:hypothetical protein